MNIVLVTPLLNVGGGQRYISILANHWASLGYNVFIIVLRKNEIFYKISDKVTIIQFTFNYSGIVNKMIIGLRTGSKLRKIIKQIQPDFVLSILSTTNVLTIISTFFLKTNIIVRDAFSPSRETKFIEKYSRKYLYRFAAGVIAQTKEIKEFTEKETANRNVKVIPNPVVKTHFDTTIERKNIVLNVGALTHRKGQGFLIEACARINAPDWKFVFLGEGEDREYLEKLIVELNVEDKIELVGSVKNVDDWLLKSSIFAFPSSLEGLPNALIEALASGLACVSFDCDTGPRDLINDGENGFLIPVGDIDLLTLRIKELMNDKKLRDKFSVKGIESTDRLNVDKIASEVLEFCIKTKKIKHHENSNSSRRIWHPAK